MRNPNYNASRASDSRKRLRSPEPVKLAPGQQYGQPINSLEVGSFRLCERTYPTGYVTPVHSHERALFCFVVNGSYSEIYGNLTRSCGPATLLFHPAEEVHAEHFHETGGRSFVIELETSWLHSLRDHSRVVATPAAFCGGTTALLGRRLYKEFREADDVSSLIIEGLLLELLGETARRVSSDVPNLRQIPRWLKQARELLRTRFVERLHALLHRSGGWRSSHASGPDFQSNFRLHSWRIHSAPPHRICLPAVSYFKHTASYDRAGRWFL